VASLDHGRGEPGDEGQRAPEVGLEHLPRRVAVAAGPREPLHARPRAVDEHIDVAERFEHPLRQRGRSAPPAEVGRHDDRPWRAGRGHLVAKSVLYHYFDSKAALYEAILEAQTYELLERVAAAVPGDHGAPRLRAGIDAYLRFLAERPPAWRLLVRDPPAAAWNDERMEAEELARALKRLADWAEQHAPEPEPAVRRRLREHFGSDLARIPVVSRTLAQ